MILLFTLLFFFAASENTYAVSDISTLTTKADLFVAAASENTYQAEVLRVIDGDTIEVKVETWPQHYIVTRIRERGVDTPEKRGKCQREKVLAEKATAFTQSKVGKTVSLRNVSPDKFGERFDAEIHTKEGRLAHLLIEAKLARYYDGKGKRLGWCNA